MSLAGDTLTVDSRTNFYAGVVDNAIALTPANIFELSQRRRTAHLLSAGARWPITVLAIDTTIFAVLSGTCTFGDCLLTFDGTNLNCPCHGCAFTTAGAVKNGPATAPLQSYVATYDGTTLTITI